MKQPYRRLSDAERKKEAPGSSSDYGARRLQPFNTNNKKNRGGRSSGKPFNPHLKNVASKNGYYNPAEIKKQREFYKNAKYIKKYKKLKQQTEHESRQTSLGLISEEDNSLGIPDEDHEIRGLNMKQGKKINLQSLREDYEKKKQEEEKARMEADAIRQAKKAEREEIVARKDLKHKMFRRTSSGQPIMKYRLDHLIENLQHGKN